MRIIHEYDQHGRHRIVCVPEGKGETEHSGWTAFTEVATFKPKSSKVEYKAATAYFNGKLPQGLFTVAPREYTVIGA